jgi:hypothetical protein
MTHSTDSNGTFFTVNEVFKGGHRNITFSGTPDGLLIETGDDYYDTRMSWESLPDFIDFLRTIRARST